MILEYTGGWLETLLSQSLEEHCISCKCCEFMSDPRTSPLDAIIKILRYLKSAPEEGMLFSDCGHS